MINTIENLIDETSWVLNGWRILSKEANPSSSYRRNSPMMDSPMTVSWFHDFMIVRDENRGNEIRANEDSRFWLEESLVDIELIRVIEPLRMTKLRKENNDILQEEEKKEEKEEDLNSHSIEIDHVSESLVLLNEQTDQLLWLKQLEQAKRNNQQLLEVTPRSSWRFNSRSIWR